MPMDCAQFEEIVHELERPSTKGFELRASALAHTESCRRCNLLFERVMSLDFALDSLVLEEADERASTRVEAALLAEFRRQHAQSTHPQRNYRAASVLAMAAALILAVALAVPRWASHTKIASNNSISSAAATNTPAVSAGAVAGNAVADDSEYATNFISLPFADDPGTLDGGTVVRVTLTRAALASFGVPVADMTSTERIPADIALSEDGVPQAIRLVANADLDQPN